jgi:hypothetical protein
LRFSRHLGQGFTPFNASLATVLPQVLQADAAVSSDLVEGYRPCFEEVDEERA